MTPINFDEANTKLIAPGCSDLPAKFDGQKWLTIWELSDTDLDNILANGKIALFVFGKGHPPVQMATFTPHPPNDAETSETPL